MLYERWRAIVDGNRDEPAVQEAGGGRRWTFDALARQAEKHAPRTFEGWVVPHGQSVEFILDVLAAWRTGRPVCPADSPGAPTPPSGADALPAGCIHLKSTSATTGRPRWIAFTGEQLAADAANIVNTMGLRRELTHIGALSLAHSYGFSNLVLPLLLHGIPLVLAESALPGALLAAAGLAPDGGVVIPAVPALWHAWLGAGAVPARLRLAISAGAPLPLGLEREMHARCGVKIHNFYGSSECGGIAFDRSDLPREDPSCVGTAMDGVQLSVMGDGCLEVRGPAVGTAYWPEPDDRLGHGRFHTHDLAVFQGHELLLRGRAVDLINVAGRKVAPEQIESVLGGHPAVRGCVAFGVPSETTARGEHVVAVVACATAAEGEAIKEHLRARLPAWQVPREWWFVDDLPANRRGKLSRAEWRERFLQGRTRRTAAS